MQFGMLDSDSCASRSNAGKCRLPAKRSELCSRAHGAPAYSAAPLGAEPPYVHPSSRASGGRPDIGRVMGARQFILVGRCRDSKRTGNEHRTREPRILVAVGRGPCLWTSIASPSRCIPDVNAQTWKTAIECGK